MGSVSLIGPNSAGKSTLARRLSGVENVRVVEISRNPCNGDGLTVRPHFALDFSTMLVFLALTFSLVPIPSLLRRHLRFWSSQGRTVSDIHQRIRDSVDFWVIDEGPLKKLLERLPLSAPQKWLERALRPIWLRLAIRLERGVFEQIWAVVPDDRTLLTNLNSRNLHAGNQNSVNWKDVQDKLQTYHYVVAALQPSGISACGQVRTAVYGPPSETKIPQDCYLRTVYGDIEAKAVDIFSKICGCRLSA